MVKQSAANKPERKLFKDWFDKDAADMLAAQMILVMPQFPKAAFVKNATTGLARLEFAGRVNQFAGALKEALPSNIPEALSIIRESFPEPLPDCESVTDGWLQWPVGQFIADYGLGYFNESMQTMVELTQRFSAEFAVRPFVDKHQKKTLDYLKTLTKHPSPHVRRWCSEGIRTRLPWGIKLHGLIENPRPILSILEDLKDDNEPYVRRSVANNLNDIAKDHPDLVVARCRKWLGGRQPVRETLIKQALRSLIKDGNPAALSVLGFAPPQKLKCELSVSQSSVTIGDDVQLVAKIASQSDTSQSLIVDYVVHYVRKNGSQSAKVFKWKSIELSAGAVCAIKKKQSFKKTSVRELYAGDHRIDLQINGQLVARTVVSLK